MLAVERTRVYGRLVKSSVGDGLNTTNTNASTLLPKTPEVILDNGKVVLSDGAAVGRTLQLDQVYDSSDPVPEELRSQVLVSLNEGYTLCILGLGIGYSLFTCVFVLS